MMRRFAPLLAGALGLVSLAVGPPVHATCAPRLLILSAFPGEIDPLLSRAHVTSTVPVDGREFFVGTLEGNDVILGLTGIGLVNATRSVQAALDVFSCGTSHGISGIVVSGVSGGAGRIGDVTIPQRWTPDAGAHFFPVDAAMFAVAGAAAGSAGLDREVPLGDPACVGTDPELIRTVQLDHSPQIRPGGEGISSDPFGGRAFPCFPAGSDVFGCRPCRAAAGALPDAARFVNDAGPFVDPNFFLDYFQSPPSVPPGYAAADMESAAVAEVALQNQIPFIAFRALSDGAGDPLMLPGFPFQFFVYRQIAAANAATVARAFLRAWAAR